MTSPVATSCSASSRTANSSARANTWRLPALTTRARATNASPRAGARQLTEMCDASTWPLIVKAAKPQAVSIMPPIIDA